MRVTRIIADLGVVDLAAAEDLYGGYLGLTHDELGLDWVTRYTCPQNGAAVQLLTRDGQAPEDPAVSVGVDDVEQACADARARGYEIVHPLTTEPWGVRRFFVRAPDGTVLDVLQHR